MWGGFGCPPARLPPWTGRRPWAGPRGRTGRWRLMRRFAASTVPLAQPVAHQDDRYHQERQGKQERLIRCEVAEPLDKCHDSLHEAGQAAGEPRPRDTAETLRRRAQRLRQSWRPAHKDLVKRSAFRTPRAVAPGTLMAHWDFIVARLTSVIAERIQSMHLGGERKTRVRCTSKRQLRHEAKGGDGTQSCPTVRPVASPEADGLHGSSPAGRAVHRRAWVSNKLRQPAGILSKTLGCWRICC